MELSNYSKPPNINCENYGNAIDFDLFIIESVRKKNIDTLFTAHCFHSFWQLILLYLVVMVVVWKILERVLK